MRTLWLVIFATFLSVNLFQKIREEILQLVADILSVFLSQLIYKVIFKTKTTSRSLTDLTRNLF